MANEIDPRSTKTRPAFRRGTASECAVQASPDRPWSRLIVETYVRDLKREAERSS